MPELMRERESVTQTEPFCAGFAGRVCEITADTEAGREWVRQCFGAYQAGAALPPQARLSVEMGHEGEVILRMTHGGQPCELAEVRANPEWKCIVPLPGAEGRLYTNTVLGPEVALEVVPGGVIVRNPEHAGLYAQMLWLWLLQRDRTLCNLHAAVVGLHGAALVLTGPSRAGKSTLSWALQQAGADFYGDETAVFTLPDLRLYPQERDLCMRPGGVEALGTLPEELAWYRFKPTDPKSRVELPRPSQPCPQERVIFLFLDGFADAPALEPIGSGEAVRRLLRGMSYGDPSVFGRLDVATELVNRYPCWRLKVGRPAETAALLAAHVRGQA